MAQRPGTRPCPDALHSPPGWQRGTRGQARHAGSPAASSCLRQGGDCLAGAVVLQPRSACVMCVSSLSPSNLFAVLVGCLWCVTDKTLVLVDVLMQTMSPHLLPAPLLRQSLGLPLSAVVLLSSCCFHSMQKQLRDCVRNLGDLTCCCESAARSFTLGEAGGSGLASEGICPPQSLQQPSQLLPSATVPLVQLSSCLSLLFAAGTATSIPSTPSVPERALTDALLLSLWHPPQNLSCGDWA